MKITDVEALYLRLPSVIADRCDGTQDALVIKVHTDAGITGVGEVDSAPLVIRAVIDAPPSHLIATGLKSLLIGEDPTEIERLWEKMYEGAIYFGRSGPVLHAMSGIDMALWDILGKSVGLPVSTLLGGAQHREVLVYASALLPETPQEAARVAASFVERGYRAIKMGWGPFGQDDKRDVEFVRSLRSAVGAETLLMIDIGYKWGNEVRATRLARRLEEFDLFWIEEPLHPDDLKGYARLVDAVDCSIACGECESGYQAFRRLIAEGNLDIVQPDLGRCGGLTEAKKIAHLVRTEGKRLVPHCFKTGVLVAATAHFVSAMPDGFLFEYTMSDSPLARNLTSSPIEFRDGYARVPDRPGLGVELDEEVVSRYRVA